MIATSMNNIQSIFHLFQFLPTNVNFMKRVFSSFSSLHVQDGIVYSLPMANVHELHGNCTDYCLSFEDSKLLINLCANLCTDEDTVLGILSEQHFTWQNNLVYVNSH